MKDTTTTETTAATTAELPFTCASAQRLMRELHERTIAPHEVAREFVEVLRGARLEAGEITFDELAERVGSIRAKSTVCRAMSPGDPKISRWVVIKSILELGLRAGPDTVQAVRGAWVAAKQAESRGTHKASA